MKETGRLAGYSDGGGDGSHLGWTWSSKEYFILERFVLLHRVLDAGKPEVHCQCLSLVTKCAATLLNALKSVAMNTLSYHPGP